VLGHEIAGTVAAVGPDASGVAVGDRRVVFPWIGCATCGPCKGGHEELCMAPRALGLNVAVTQTAAADTHDDFAADGMRRLAKYLSQWLPERVEGIAEHGSHLVSCPAHSSGAPPTAPR
jgi:Zn-dependent alcohol dehydrogenase